MVGHKCPGKAFGAGFDKKFGETFKEQTAVIVVDKNIPSLDSANSNVLQQTGDVYACCTGHERKIAEEVKLVDKSTTSPLTPNLSSFFSIKLFHWMKFIMKYAMLSKTGDLQNANSFTLWAIQILLP